MLVFLWRNRLAIRLVCQYINRREKCAKYDMMTALAAGSSPQVT
jgi:hypothetical protein